MTKPSKIAIVGGGPAGMAAALELSKTHEVHLFEKGKTLGRKFLVAGKGGFNLTNSISGADLFSKYQPEGIFKEALLNFDSSASRLWLEELGIPTFIGSSGRVFPEKGIKPIAVLNALKNRMLALGTNLYFEHECVDFSANTLCLKHKDKTKEFHFDYCVFALGGASWSVTGSTGNWLSMFKNKGIATLPFQASNCGLEIESIQNSLESFRGTPLKNIAIRCSDKHVKGEAIICSYGLEGNAIYPISNEVRKQLDVYGTAHIRIDLKPFQTETQLLSKITPSTLPKNYAYIFNLNKTQIALIKTFTDKKTYLNPTLFVGALKSLPIKVDSLRPIEEAISTVGGIDCKALNTDFNLKKFPNIYIAGEMFDWDAPTGGFLLQGCFSTAMHITSSLLSKL